MKVKLELKENWQLQIFFEYAPVVLPVPESTQLRLRMLDVTAAFRHVPVNLLSFHEISHMWATGNGAYQQTSTVIGEMKRLTFDKAPIESPNSTWLKAEVAMHQNPEAMNWLLRKALEDPLTPTSRVREDFAVFPRMRVNTIPESQPRIGEQHRRMQFTGFGPILALDCVYGVQRRQILQTIEDANYIKKHQRDLPREN